MKIGEKWMTWTLLEAGTRTLSKMTHKVVGSLIATLAYTFFSTAIVGLVQVAVSYAIVRSKKIKLIDKPANIIGACLFGFFAVIASIFAFGAFYYGGDIGVNSFIITLSIVPGALIDKFFFNHKLIGREWFGILIAILAGYAILGWPSLAEFARLPLWVWMSFGTMLPVAINQGITQKIKDINPFVKNFWGGLTTILLCMIALFIIGEGRILFEFSAPPMFYIVSTMTGLIAMGIWTFNLMGYKGGASIAIKKLVMNGTYLILAMICGIVFFGEQVSFGKGVGVGLYLVAFAFMDQGTWNFLSSNARNA